MPKRSVLGYISLNPGLNTSDTPAGQMPAGSEPVFPAVKAETGAVSKIVQTPSSDVSQNLADRSNTPIAAVQISQSRLSDKVNMTKVKVIFSIIILIIVIMDTQCVLVEFPSSQEVKLSAVHPQFWD